MNGDSTELPGGRPEARSRERLASLALIVAGAVLLGVAGLLTGIGRDVICDPDLLDRLSLRRCTRYVFPTARGASSQLGMLALGLGLGLGLLSRLAPRRSAAIRASIRGFALRGLVIASIAFVTGEVALRVLYWDGISFGTHDGPFVRRFERDFVMNRYDGPSRGPDVEGPKAPGVKRVLIQGDSITWGQGVEHESQLYAGLLLERVRERNARVEMAVLATGGREIDGHLEQLRRWGPEIDPDVIVYQWYVNDIELDKSGRPIANPPWRRLFLHPVMASASAFWFFVDHALTGLWPTSRSYEAYLLAEYAPGSPAWGPFEAQFSDWVAEARSLTPRLLVALYPQVMPPSRMLYEAIHERMRTLCAQHGVATLDWIDAFRDLEGEYERLWASPFDAHPSALAHERMAAALYDRLESTWPAADW